MKIGILTKSLLWTLYIKQRKSSLIIAKVLLVSKPTILKYLRLFNIRIRTTSEACKGKINRRKGGRIIRQAYVYIYTPNHPNSNTQGYYAEHRLVMEKHLDRYLTKEEVVHHRGIKYPRRSVENKRDNRIKNLQLFKNKSTHTKFHYELGDSNIRGAK